MKNELDPEVKASLLKYRVEKGSEAVTEAVARHPANSNRATEEQTPRKKNEIEARPEHGRPTLEHMFTKDSETNTHEGTRESVVSDKPIREQWSRGKLPGNSEAEDFLLTQLVTNKSGVCAESAVTGSTHPSEIGARQSSFQKGQGLSEDADFSKEGVEAVGFQSGALDTRPRRRCKGLPQDVSRNDELADFFSNALQDLYDEEEPPNKQKRTKASRARDADGRKRTPDRKEQDSEGDLSLLLDHMIIRDAEANAGAGATGKALADKAGLGRAPEIPSTTNAPADIIQDAPFFPPLLSSPKGDNEDDSAGPFTPRGFEWKRIPLNAPMQDDNPRFDLYSNGNWKPGALGYLCKQLWKRAERQMAGIASVSDVLSGLPLRNKQVRWLLRLQSGGLRQAWLDLPKRERILLWRDTVLRCLASSPHTTLLFLEETHTDLPYVPWLFIFALNSIRWWHWKVIYESPANKKTFDNLVHWAIEKSIEVDYIHSWRAGSLFLQFCTLEQGQKVFDLLTKKETPMSATMALRFMNFFTKAGDVEYALRAFVEVAQYPAALEWKITLRSCSMLLQQDYVQQNELSQNFRILPEMLGAGIEPNLILHNITLANSYKARLSNVVWDVFNYMQQKDLPTSSYTYLVLLQDCVRAGDMARLSEVLAKVQQREDLTNNIHIIGHILHTIRILSRSQEQIAASSAFDQMLAFYTNKLKPTPLQQLLQLPLAIDPALEAYKIEPSAAILQMMTYSYITTAATSTAVIQLWTRFRRLVSEDVDWIRPLARTPHIYDAFLIFFSRSRTISPKYILDVIDFRLQSDLPWHCKVTEHSFMLAAVGLLSHEQRWEAKNCMLMMLEKGIRPDVEVWKEAHLSRRQSDARIEAINMLARIEREELERLHGKQSILDLDGWAEVVDYDGGSEHVEEVEDGEDLNMSEEAAEVEVMSSAGG